MEVKEDALQLQGRFVGLLKSIKEERDKDVSLLKDAVYDIVSQDERNCGYSYESFISGVKTQLADFMIASADLDKGEKERAKFKDSIEKMESYLHLLVTLRNRLSETWYQYHQKWMLNVNYRSTIKLEYPHSFRFYLEPIVYSDPELIADIWGAAKQKRKRENEAEQERKAKKQRCDPPSK